MNNLKNSYVSKLDAEFYDLQNPDAHPNAKLILFNEPLAQFLNLELTNTDNTQLTDFFSGTTIPKDASPISMIYAGHQFGHFNPQLGDGRAVMLGDVQAQDGNLYDIQLKGSGQTRFSRQGDGKSALGPVLREYIVSEAMYHLGIPTTRALAAVTTGEKVHRQQLEPGGVLTRVARGHIRIGSFEFFASRQMQPQVKQLADFSIERFYPELVTKEQPYLAFFETVARRLMSLVAKWQGLGFIHGVMNTDNMSIAAETIDYGPCAFMDSYRADKVFSSIDQNGRYAYNEQPAIAQWNLSILASCLVPLIDEDSSKAIEKLQEVMKSLQGYYQLEWLKVFRSKFGLFNSEPGDNEFIQTYLKHLERKQGDFTLSFRELLTERSEAHTQRLSRQEESIQDAIELMSKSNPYLIPRNHQVQSAIDAAYEGNFDHFKRLVEAYQKPFETKLDNEDLTEPPQPSEMVYQTFCGT